MATPRQKVQVGIFLSICGFLLLAVLVAVGGLQREETAAYTIEFDESVSGLASGSDVRYRGVLVGRVTDIAVQPNNRIRVGIDVRSNAIHIRPGMVAQLGAAGITGQLYVNLSGGDASAEPLPAGSSISSLPSLFTNISTALPTMLASTNAILLRIEKALGKEGQVPVILAATEQLLAGVDKAITEFSLRSSAVLDRLDALAGDKLLALIEELTDTAKTVNQFLSSSEPVLQRTLTSSAKTLERLERHVAALDTKRTGVSLRRTLDGLTTLAGRLDKSTEELSLTLQSMRRDTSNVEFHFRQAVRTWRETLVSAKELLDYLEQDPSSLIIGRRAPARSRDGSSER